MLVFLRLQLQHRLAIQSPVSRRIHTRSVPAPLVFPQRAHTAPRSASRPHGTELSAGPAAASHAAMAQSSPPAGDVFFLDAFALRQWDDSKYSGTRIAWDKADFVNRIHEYHGQGAPLVDGYAPFCKHVFVPNFVGAKAGAMPVTDENRHLLRCGYSSRRPEELPVLTRWFSASDVTVSDAKFLDVILYSAEQLAKEYLAMPSEDRGDRKEPPAPWGIISVKAQEEDFETPMQPITVMRNALGGEHGGSGVPLDRAAYDASVEYWRDRAVILWGEQPAGE